MWKKESEGRAKINSFHINFHRKLNRNAMFVDHCNLSHSSASTNTNQQFLFRIWGRKNRWQCRALHAKSHRELCGEKKNSSNNTTEFFLSSQSYMQIGLNRPRPWHFFFLEVLPLLFSHIDELLLDLNVNSSFMNLERLYVACNDNKLNLTLAL